MYPVTANEATAINTACTWIGQWKIQHKNHYFLNRQKTELGFVSFYSSSVCLYSRGYTYNRPKWLCIFTFKIINHSILEKWTWIIDDIITHSREWPSFCPIHCSIEWSQIHRTLLRTKFIITAVLFLFPNVKNILYFQKHFLRMLSFCLKDIS